MRSRRNCSAALATGQSKGSGEELESGPAADFSGLLARRLFVVLIMVRLVSKVTRNPPYRNRPACYGIKAKAQEAEAQPSW